MNVSRRKNEVRVSLAYIFAFLTPNPCPGFGDASMGITAGRGIDGAGDADLRIEVDEPNDDLLLWLIVLGGFMGRPWAVGVLGSDGFGDSAP